MEYHSGGTMIIINQATDIPDAGLAAKKICKELSKIAKTEKLEISDNFFFDLKVFEGCINKMGWDEQLILYWCYDMNGGRTIYSYLGEKWWDGCVKVTINRPIGNKEQWNITLEVL
jgi:hypothetical protein